MVDDDIVERMRSLADQADDVPVAELEQALRDGADAIERLRAEMQRWVPLVLKGADAAS